MMRSSRKPTGCASIWLAACLVMFASLPVAAAEYAFVLSTDYWSTAYYSTIQIEPPRTTDIDIEPVSTDPVAYYDVQEDMVFVVNRYLADNIQVVEPGPVFSTIAQYSVGNGSNPHDIRLASDKKAYVSRYEWKTLLIVDPYSGDSLGVIDLSPMADADGIPEMDRMEIVGNLLFVTLNNIDRTTWLPAGPGKIAVIDTEADTLVDCDPGIPGVQPITLDLPNPYSKLRYDPCRMELVVACLGAWGVLDGGVEVVDPIALETKGVMISEADMGGDISDAVFTPGAKCYAVVMEAVPWPDNFARLVGFDRETGEVADTLYEQTSGSGSSLAGIELNRQQELYLCDRDVVDPAIRIFDTPVDTLITKIGVGVPPFDIAFLQTPHAGLDDWTEVEPAYTSSLCQNNPNPFRSMTRISFNLDAHSQAVDLTVYDALGRHVRTLLDTSMPGGSHSVTWDALDSRAGPVAAGVYFYRLRTDGGASTKRMILLR